MKNKRILMVHNSYIASGGEDVVVNEEIELLKQNGFEVGLIEFDNDKSILLKTANTLQYRNNLFSTYNFEKKLKEFKPDVVYVHNTWFTASLGIFKILEKYNTPTYIKLHNFRFSCANAHHYRNGSSCHDCTPLDRSSGIKNKCYRGSYLQSALVSDYGKRLFKLLSKSYIKKILILSPFHYELFQFYGLDKNKMEIFHTPVEVYPDEYEDPSNFSDVLYLGRLTEEKGIFDLLSAWSLNKNRKFNLFLYGEDLNNLATSYKVDKTINFMGFQDKKFIDKHLKKSRAVIFPTRVYEGQGMVPLEAAIFRRATISPHLGGMKQLYPKENIFMYRRYDIKSLAEKIALLEDDELVNKQGKLNRDHVISNFSREVISKELLKLFE